MTEKQAAQLAELMGEECLAVRARLLSRVVTALYDREMRPLGLKANQCTMLVCMAREGDIDQAGIGRILKMEKSTVSRGIDRLKAQGWIESSGSDNHRLRLTTSGRELLREIHCRWLLAQRKAAKLLGLNGIARLKDITAPLFRR
jgi:DNA-binding MarR family transcriptional regulator